MQKFLTDTLEGRFVKALLYNTYLPTYKTVRKGDYVIKDNLYIYNNYVVKCTANGNIGTTGTYKTITEYVFGERYPKFTDNFISKNNNYDSDTHIRLGKYLRCYRDIYNIDLMPFYNCYCNKYTSKLVITENGVSSELSSNLYKTVIVPIKFNQIYTIAIDCPSKCTFAPAFMQNGDLLTVLDENISQRLWTQETIVSYPSLMFSDPITYKITTTQKSLETYENNLVLLIQIPFSSDSSVVVLEGDYLDKSHHVVDVSVIHELDKVQQNKLFLSHLSLLRMNDRNSYAFTDRLIEYLLDNVITPLDEVTGDIKRVQEASGANKYFSPIEDVWDDKLRMLLYNKYYEYTNSQVDINGYVDKDIEKYLLRKK